jgi:hypothetical protein
VLINRQKELTFCVFFLDASDAADDSDEFSPSVFFPTNISSSILFTLAALGLVLAIGLAK